MTLKNNDKNHPPNPPSFLPRSISMSSFTSIDLNENDSYNKQCIDELNRNSTEKDEYEIFEFNKHDNSYDDNENDKDKSNNEETTDSVPFHKMFQYASTVDKIFMALGSFLALFLGFTFPLIILLIGRMTDTFIQYDIFHKIAIFNDTTQRYEYWNLDKINNTYTYYEKIKEYYYLHNYTSILSPDQIRSRFELSIEDIVKIYNDSIFHNGTLYMEIFQADTGKISLYIALISIGSGILNYFALGLWEQAARNQIHRMKLQFFRSIIHQDISWFDLKDGDFASKISNDLNMVQQGIGDKIALCLISFSTLIISIIMAFYHGWELTLVSMAIMPILGIAFLIIGKIQMKFTSSELLAYGKAGAIAEEVINMIQTVYAFGGQEKEIERYRQNIEPARTNGIRRSLFTGITLGLMNFSIYASYGLSLWYGVRLIIHSNENPESASYQASTMLIVFFNVLTGTFSFGQSSPYFESIARSCGAAGIVFKIMKQKPKIDSFSQIGKRINIKGKIKFHNVHFTYPGRKEIKVLNGIDFEAKPGEIIALVGSSGCGKSTIIQLIQRFYDPDSGNIFIDNNDIKDLNVGSLRDQIGLVGQEPVLFGYSIEKNIAFGHPEASMEEVIQAAKEANAYNFIQNLPNKFNTLVGKSGAQLSGGQKQRIAIARALIRRPKILLLDESTCALDSESESIVQATLDKASIGRTTFIVTHRLSTIRNANKIIVIDQGQIKEMGTHQELINSKGIYFNMSRLQNQHESMNLIRKKQVDLKINNGDSQMTFVRSKSTDELNQDIEGNDLDNTNLPIRRLIKFITPDRYYLIIATLFSFLFGLVIPIYSFIFGEVLYTLSNSDVNYIRQEVLKYSLIFLAIGTIAGILQFFQTYLYGISSENLTFRLRNELFRSILQQEVAWFDKPSNNTGTLCARLSNDAAAVQGATGSRLSVIAQTISILFAGIFISMTYSWKLSLVMLCFVPLILISVYFQMKILMGMTTSKRKATEEATKIALETISNIRTVASLRLELTFWINYQTALEIDFKKSRLEPHIKSFTFGFANIILNLAYAVTLFYGSRLIIRNELDYSKLFKSFEAVLFGTNMIGQSIVFSLDYQKGKIAAISIFRLVDRIPKIVVNSIFGAKLSECHGELSFKDVEFRYPNRSQTKILKRISFDVMKGQRVALVGASGCGKSTCTRILERFYDINHGEILFDNHNIYYLNLAWFRSQIGVVFQEPMLFNKSIAENIAYGDNSKKVKMEEVIRVAQRVNIHEFIESLPKKYETIVGDKGTQLSVGQKKRIAIARALIRNPKILLLDEATSALDSENETIIQQTLNEDRHKRTCLIIAHHLSTIRDVDRIYVIDDGYIVEEGTHQELLEKCGLYYQMYMVQCGTRS